MSALLWPFVALVYAVVLWRAVEAGIGYVYGRSAKYATKEEVGLVRDIAERVGGEASMRLQAIEDRLTALDQRAPPSIAKPDPMARFRR